MKQITPILVLLTGALSASAMRTTNTVTGTVDTRDYQIIISSPSGDIYPGSGTLIRSWRSSVSSFVYESPVFEQDGKVLRLCSGFSGSGISPASGSGDSASVMLTNVTSTLTWNWDSSFWVSWTVSGQGAVQPIDMAYSGSGAWFAEGVTNHLRAVPDYGWLFTDWSGGVSAGPSASNLYFAATEPMNVVASFSDDPDGDGLKNTNEWACGANPWMSDTDGDEFDDAFEFANGLSPVRDSSAFLTHIQDHPETYGLYPSNAVLDVALGQAGMQIDGGVARIHLQLEKSEDLQSWTNAGDAVEWTLSVDSDKKFMRVRGMPPSQ